MCVKAAFRYDTMFWIWFISHDSFALSKAGYACVETVRFWERDSCVRRLCRRRGDVTMSQRVCMKWMAAAVLLLVSASAAYASDGTVVEVFEWAAGGMERAHSNPAVLALWARYGDACDYVPLTSLPEASNMFASFTPIEL